MGCRLGETLAFANNHEHPEVRERLRAEVLANAPSGPIGPAQLRAMPYPMQVIDEVKRTCPNVPMSFGPARRDIDVGGYTVPQGALVMMAIPESNLDPIFTAPETFDPERFSAERDEKKRAPDAFMPQARAPSRPTNAPATISPP
jgi:retinoid hydroxylase